MVTQDTLDTWTANLNATTDDLVALIEANDRDGALAYSHNLIKTPALAGVIMHFTSIRLLQWMKEPPYDKLRLGLECTTLAPELRQEIFWQLMLKNAVRTEDFEVVQLMANYVDPCWQFSSGLRETVALRRGDMFQFLYPISDGAQVRANLDHQWDDEDLAWWDEQVALAQRDLLHKVTSGAGSFHCVKKI